MNTVKLSNISISEFKEFLEEQGCEQEESGNEGHEKWSKAGCIRPVVFQTHIDPIPEFIIRNNLRNLEVSRKDFTTWYLSKKSKKKSTD